MATMTNLEWAVGNVGEAPDGDAQPENIVAWVQQQIRDNRGLGFGGGADLDELLQELSDEQLTEYIRQIAAGEVHAPDPAGFDPNVGIYFGGRDGAGQTLRPEGAGGGGLAYMGNRLRAERDRRGLVGEDPDRLGALEEAEFVDIVELDAADLTQHIEALTALRETGALPSLEENRRIVRRLREMEEALNELGGDDLEGRVRADRAQSLLDEPDLWNQEQIDEAVRLAHELARVPLAGREDSRWDRYERLEQELLERLDNDGRLDADRRLPVPAEDLLPRRPGQPQPIDSEEPPVNLMDIADIMDEMAVLRRMHGGEAGIPDSVGRRYQELYEEHIRARPNAPKPEQLRNRAGLIARGDGDRPDAPDSGVDGNRVGPQPPWSAEPGRFWRDDQIEHHMGNQNDEALGRIVRDEDDWPNEQGLNLENLRRADREAFRQQARLELERRRENRRPGTTLVDLENMNRDELNQRVTRLIMADPEGDDDGIRAQLEGALLRRDRRLQEDSARSPSAAYHLAQRNNLQALGDDEIDEEIRKTQAALGLVDDPHGGDYEGLRERLANALAERGVRRRVAAVDSEVPDTAEAPAVPEAPAVDVPEVLRTQWEALQGRFGGDRDFDDDDRYMFDRFLKFNDKKIRLALENGENVEAARLRAFRLMATKQLTDFNVARGVASLRDGDMRLVGEMESHRDMLGVLYKSALGGRLTPEQLNEIIAATARFEGDALRDGGYGAMQNYIRAYRRRMVELSHIPRVELGAAERARLMDLDRDGFVAEVTRITGAVNRSPGGEHGACDPRQ